jgi:hypothetical protein
MHIGLALALTLAFVAPAFGQGLSSPVAPGGSRGQSQPETPQQKREFCQRVAGAALRCGPTTDAVALSSCVIRTLPVQDSLRVAQAANAARGNASALLSECGVGLGGR